MKKQQKKEIIEKIVEIMMILEDEKRDQNNYRQRVYEILLNNFESCAYMIRGLNEEKKK